jgi:hypothetical protein
MMRASNTIRLAALAFILPAVALSTQTPAPQPFAPWSDPGLSLFAGATFSPDSQTVYFTRHSAFEVDAVKTILVSHRLREGWSKPEPAPFSGPWSDTTPFVSPDGTRLYFASNRPVEGRAKDDFDIWFVERANNGWGVPRHESAIASTVNETSPAVTARGVLYFCSWREEGGLGQGDLWRAEPLGDTHGAPRNLGSPVNGPTGEWGVTVSPDERLLVFESSGRVDGMSGSGDLYVSRNDGAGWSPPRHLDAPINTAASELSPRFSPDGRTLYFASNRRGRLEMWQVAFSIADALRLAGRP